jgi:hypothetical protein
MRNIMREELKKSLGQELSKVSDHFKRNGSVWVAPLSNGRTYAVMLEFSDKRFIPSTVSVYCGIYDKGIKPVQDLTALERSYVKFPYKIHHHLFETPGAVWFKKKAGYAYWLLLMQSKKMHVNNPKQLKYSKEVLMPYAAKQASEKYDKIHRHDG